MRLTKEGTEIRSLFLILALATAPAAPTTLAAQRRVVAWDLSAGFGNGAGRIAAAGWLPFELAQGRVRIAFGVRITGFGGETRSFANRDGVQGLLASTLPVDPSVYAVNGAVAGEVQLEARLGVGANIDLAGVATGPQRAIGSVDLEPARWSVLQVGNGDRGSLNSEFYLSLRVSHRVQARAGASHYVLGYRGTDSASGSRPSARYQRFETVPFVAVRLGW